MSTAVVCRQPSDSEMVCAHWATAPGRYVFGSYKTAEEFQQTSAASRPRVTRKSFLNSLRDRKELKIVSPIECTIKPTDKVRDNFIASVVGLRLYASGDTEAEALDNVEDIIAAKYLLYCRVGESRLSEELRQEFSVLKQHIAQV